MSAPAVAKSATTTPVAPLRVALIGNPNTGKSTLFNALSGLRQRVGNYPGVTVEKKTGTAHFDEGPLELIDLPGTYSLAPRSPDEMLAVDVLLGTQFSTTHAEPVPDAIVCVVDATNLERNLFLASQVTDLGMPTVIALTMGDLARNKGTTLDADKLTQALRIPVIPVHAPNKIGLRDLANAVRRAVAAPSPAAQADFPPEFLEETAALAQQLPVTTPAARRSHLAQRLLIDVGGYLEQKLLMETPALRARLDAARQRLQAAKCAVPGIEARTRYRWIKQQTAGAVTQGPAKGPDWTARLDAVLTHPVGGLAIFLVLMFLVFQSIFTWAAPLMDAIDAGKGWVAGQLEGTTAAGPLRGLLVQGVLEGVGGVLIFLPQIMILFFFIAILEDCGYMARAAFLMDKLMSRCGLSGKSFIPLLSSFACAIPGIMAARVIEDRRDRLATVLIAPLMSCSARLPVYLLLAGTFFAAFGSWVPGLVIFGMYLLGLIVAPLVAWALKRTVLRGETPIFLLELPAYKWPSWRLVLHRMFDRGWAFVRRAGTVILASMILVWALLYFPHRDAQGRLYEERLAELAATEEPLAAELEAKPKDKLLKAKVEELQSQQKKLLGEWRTGSYLGQMGKAIEPAVRPLGWDWRLGMAALASFPAREVVVGTLGIIYDEGEVDANDEEARAALGDKLKAARWDTGSAHAGLPVFTVPVALSVMVFFVFCCQCASTLAVLKRETNSWRWPVFAFVYMTLLAYVAALVTYQVGRWF